MGAIEERGLWSFNRQPLAMGLLTGKYHGHSPKVGAQDMRSRNLEWMRYFDETGAPTQDLVKAVEAIRDLLTEGGRTVAQGALSWCLAQSERAIPLPGCRSPQQAAANLAAATIPPLTKGALEEIHQFVGKVQRPAE